MDARAQARSDVDQIVEEYGKVKSEEIRDDLEHRRKMEISARWLCFAGGVFAGILCCVIWHAIW